jgi:hypothetical protein
MAFGRLKSIALSLAALALAGGAQQGALASWQVVVEDEKTPAGKKGADWVTYLVDEKTKREIPGFLAFVGNGLYALNVNGNEGNCSCKDGKYPFSYKVDELLARPVDSTQEKALLGDLALESARAVMRDHQASCDGIKPLPGQPESTESYERSKMRLLSNYNGNLGLEVVTESFSYGKPTAMVSTDWGSYKLDKEPITREGKKYLPDGAAAEASAKFTKLAAAEREGFSPADLSHFVFAPNGGGMAIEFGVPGTTEATRKQTRLVRVERTNAAGDYEKVRQSFVKEHPGLIAFNKTDFYTVAPDGSAVVYAQNGSLYWQGAAGKPKLIGKVVNVRGWQWHHGS